MILEKKETMQNVQFGSLLIIEDRLEQGEKEVVYVVDNSTAGNGYPVVLMDMSGELIIDYKSIEDLVNSSDIKITMVNNSFQNALRKVEKFMLNL